jgi:hypothetical protein
MSKLAITVLLTGTLSSTISQAFPGLPKVGEEILEARQYPEASCPDFTGLWQGHCRHEKEALDEERTLEIKQTGCNAIKIDGQDLPIGGIARQSRVDQVEERTVETTFDWNAERTQGLIVENGSGRSLGQADHWTSGADGVLELKNGQLVTASGFHFKRIQNGKVKITGNTYNCRFAKK